MITRSQAKALDEMKAFHGEPPAWANTRPALCDAIEWFRSVQGGSYQHDKLCFGFLVDGCNGARPYLDEEVIITRMGGDSEKVSESELVLKKDQEWGGIIITAIMAAFNIDQPVGLVIGKLLYSHGFQLPHRYCVMDYFRITDVWHERMGTHAGFRIRFEKLDLSTKSWWAPRGSLDPPPLALRNFNMLPSSQMCSTCGKASTQIYMEGWMCLEPECSKFWKIGNADPTNLTYHPDFLSYRSLGLPGRPAPGPLVNTADRKLREWDRTVDRNAWRGIVCPDCKKCLQRILWCGWKCSVDPALGPHESCCYQAFRNIIPVSIKTVIAGVKSYGRNQLTCRIQPSIDPKSCKPYETRTYVLPGVGSITHFVSNKGINERPGGPHDLFRNLQNVDLGLRRYPLSQAVVGGTLTGHFVGMPYKYVVSVDSRAFSGAPPVILAALGRLSWATEKAVINAGDDYLPPNELLALGYFEGMKIGYHDDGESTLGPTIATLSLGSKSKMCIRMKAKYYNGATKANVPLAIDPVLGGCNGEQERRLLKDEFEAGQLTEEEYRAEREGMLRTLKSRANPPDMIKLELQHGDMVVMHGADLQKYFEHSVIPEQRLRFALTSRYIVPELIPPEQHWKGEFELRGDQIYNGQ
ncbi:uncharacterized protein N7482_002960 [Penicillium canariense]|uniref:Alpha-ketoglutarate-dependent dioxygenase AlkB-like domain-containing protein n=1 Tax=Penicillium canariense TaxID=189055 RepID=A0A9W9IG63_9EURO|nr:uncharacterized protein N7482_002960 [Penicillium canariense]KAJ5177083.1 hypothetical protein N7482_002960 [Penicillium canariense]